MFTVANHRVNAFLCSPRAGSVVLLLIALFAAPVFSFARLQDKNANPTRQRGDDEAVRLHSDLVVANLIVTDAGGLYAHGLNAKNFTVLEDGIPQSINSFLAEESPFAAAILIDMSGSMDYKFGLVRAAAASFVDHIRENDQVAVYGFNN